MVKATKRLASLVRKPKIRSAPPTVSASAAAHAKKNGCGNPILATKSMNLSDGGIFK